MIMAMPSPRETHDWRDYNLLGAGTLQNPPKKETPKLRIDRSSHSIIPKTQGSVLLEMPVLPGPSLNSASTL